MTNALKSGRPDTLIEPGRAKTALFVLIILIAFPIAIFVVLDGAYSAIIAGLTEEPGVKDAFFHHTFRPNFRGLRNYGQRYWFYTNNLGFADRSVHTISPGTSKHRVMFLGDSFTEGLGFPYGETFIGIF